MQVTPDKTSPTPFAPTRAEALARLRHFVPRAGKDYARLRNYDLPDEEHPHVSGLSPYLRHRLITEAEVVEAVLARHSQQAAEKFLQEVFWRSYWKGWLEMRPEVWAAYVKGRDRALAAAPRDAELQAALARAEAGQTEIEAFNAWITELTTTGYLHNHARMWVASIWIFTLRLPWELGADLFLRHLLDGDPASNTLGWRWVAGLQTVGKHYIARSSNISKYTNGRHNPGYALNTQAEPLSGSPHPERRAAPKGGAVLRGQRSVVLLTEEDLSPGFLVPELDDCLGCAGLHSTGKRSPSGVSDRVMGFANGAVADAMERWSGRLGGAGPVTDDIEDIRTWALHLGAEQVVTPYAPIGPAASRLRSLSKRLSEDGVVVIPRLRARDARAWPHATHGFFRFKSQIPDLIDALQRDRAPELWDQPPVG